MRVDRIALRGVTRFADDVAVELAELGEGLIAFAGPNGAGKTTLLEAAFAGIHLEYPSRPGALHQVCHGKDAKISLTINNGQVYRTAVCVDAELKQPKTEAYLYDGAWQPVSDGKVRTYQGAVEQLFGSPRLMLSAALSAQSKRGSFLDLSKAERKDLLSEILDTAGLQSLAEAARAKAKAAELQLERLRGQLQAAEDELARLQIDAVDVDALSRERDEKEAAIAKLAAELEAAREKYAELQRQQTEADAARCDVERLTRDLRGIGEQIGAKKAAEQRLEDAHRARIATLEREIDVALTEAGNVEQYEHAAAELQQQRAARDDARLKLTEATAYLEEVRAQLATAERRAAEARAKRQVLEGRLAAAKRSSGLLDEVPCTVENEWLSVGRGLAVGLPSVCPLLADARAGRGQVAELEQQLAAIGEVDTAEHLEAVRVAATTQDEAAGDLHLIEQRIADLEPVASRLEAARSAADRVDRGRKELDAAAEEHRRRLAELEHERDGLLVRQEQLEHERDRAAASIPEDLTGQLTAAAQQGRELRTQHDEAQTSLRELERQVARAEAAEERKKELEATCVTWGAEVNTVSRDLADWQLLERALGRDGVQALEIDAAGPELSEITNELLQACFGPRFEVSFVTQALKRDGGMKEVFDVTVIDHDRGREGSVDTLSGGEKTIVSEAISLALAIYVGKHSEHRFATLFRDETAGALDPDNAHRYIQMLRRARSLAGAYQIVFVAQQTEVWEQADAVVWIDGGRAEVR